MKRYAWIALAALTGTAVVAEAEEIALEEVAMRQSQNEPTPKVERHDSGVMNTSARTTDVVSNWFLFADALYWRVEEGRTEWALGASQTGTTSTGLPITKEHMRKVDFDWDWGFRVGIGYNFEFDEWDTALSYTWLHTEKTDQYSLDQNSAPSGIPVGFPKITSLITAPAVNSDLHTPVNSFDFGKISWEVHFNCLDWELGRNYHVSKHLALRPHAGIKGAWINQHIDGRFRQTEFSNTHTFYKIDNDFWGVGPSGGVNTQWRFCNDKRHFFSIFADFAGALLYGHFDVDENNFDQAVPGVGFGEQKFSNFDRNLVAPMLQTAMGFGWDMNFNKDKCHVGVKLGYELQYWFRQNQIVTPFSLERLDGDLAMQGGTLDLRFDF